MSQRPPFEVEWDDHARQSLFMQASQSGSLRLSMDTDGTSNASNYAGESARSKHGPFKVIEHGTGLLKREKERGRLAKLEAVVCKLMVHPNIVTTYAFHTGLVPTAKLSIAGRGARQGGEKMVTLLVQEFCSRGTLRDALKDGALGSRRAGLAYCKTCAMLGAQIAYGLQHAHSVGVVHCDLKAENVLLQSLPEDQRFDGDLDVRAKLGDLGIASVFPSDLADVGTTAMHGTVSHMPPEALEEPNIISTKTDIWSFGMVMWEMWTGELPYAGMPPHKVIKEVLARQLPEWPENTPPVWKSLAAKCWSLDAACRPTTFQLTKALDEITAVLSKVDVATAASSGGPVPGGAPAPPGPQPGLSVVDELDELAMELALMEDDSAARNAPWQGGSGALRSASGRFTEGSFGKVKMPDAPFELPLTAPSHDPVASLLWHMLQEPRVDECLEVEAGSNRKVYVTKLPYLDLGRLGLADNNRLRKTSTASPAQSSNMRSLPEQM